MFQENTLDMSRGFDASYGHGSLSVLYQHGIELTHTI